MRFCTLFSKMRYSNSGDFSSNRNRVPSKVSLPRSWRNIQGYSTSSSNSHRFFSESTGWLTAILCSFKPSPMEKMCGLTTMFCITRSIIFTVHIALIFVDLKFLLASFNVFFSETTGLITVIRCSFSIPQYEESTKYRGCPVLSFERENFQLVL